MALRLLLVGVLIASGGPIRSQAPPLPDEQTFFAEARKRLAGNDLIQSRYAFRERTAELKLNPLGRLGTGPDLVYEVYPHPNDDLTFRRLVERGGRPVPAAEIAEQDRRYREKLRAWERRVAREGQSERIARLRKAKETEAEDAARAQEALDLFTFSIVGREIRNGEPAIVVSFAPRPDRHARSRQGRIAKAFAGRAWVHETEFEVMDVEATAIDDVSFGFGIIARLNKGSTARFTRRRVNGVWLPVETRFEGTGRALLFRKVEIQYYRVYSDYRPFDPAELPALLGWQEPGEGEPPGAAAFSRASHAAGGCSTPRPRRAPLRPAPGRRASRARAAGRRPAPRTGRRGSPGRSSGCRGR
jgi:hypothetical protein